MLFLLDISTIFIEINFDLIITQILCYNNTLSNLFSMLLCLIFLFSRTSFKMSL